MSWESKKDIEYLLANNFRRNGKIFAFDLDWTLITPRKHRFPKKSTDWIWYNDSVIEKLSSIAENADIVIFSNQKKSSKNTIEKNHEKFSDIANELLKNGIEVSMFFATGKKSRKPSRRMYDLFLVKADIENPNEITYVGDAYGSDKPFTQSSDSDLLFAKECDMKFVSTRSFFGKCWKERQIVNTISENQCVVFLVGPPACGKSTFAKFLSKKTNAKIVSNDSDGYAKVPKLAKKYLSDDFSVIIDNTNASLKARKRISIPDGVSKIAIIFETPISTCKEINSERDKPVPAMAYGRYFGDISRDGFPTRDEGFDKIFYV